MSQSSNNHAQRAPPEREQGGLRVLVVPDPAAPVDATIDAIRSLISGSRAELLGLYVEDTRLVRIAGLSVAREVSIETASAREFNREELERQFRSQAAKVRNLIERAANRMRLGYAFRVTRGEPVSELMSAASEADLLIISRSVRTMGPRSWLSATYRELATAESRVVAFVQEAWAAGRRILALFDGSEGSGAALRLALEMADKDGLPLVVLLPCTTVEGFRDLHERAEASLRDQQSKAVYRHIKTVAAPILARVAAEENARVIVLPGGPDDERRDLLADLLQRVDCAVVTTRELAP